MRPLELDRNSASQWTRTQNCITVHACNAWEVKNKMNIPFWKMHGASNDFILVDDRDRSFPIHDHAWLAKISSRRTGVGCEGIILIQPSTTSDFRMRFFNPDGNEVEMCGNGARCVARLAHDIGIASNRMAFDTASGLIHAETEGDNILIQMTEPHSWKFDQPITFGGQVYTRHFVDSGVPHVVIPVDDLEAIDVQAFGATVRYHEDYAAHGANANFVQVTGPSSLRVRTYERGVENETLACGTGIVACALIGGRMGWVDPPIWVTPASGDVIEINYDLTDEGATNVTMRGPTELVFEGILTYPSQP